MLSVGVVVYCLVVRPVDQPSASSLLDRTGGPTSRDDSGLIAPTPNAGANKTTDHVAPAINEAVVGPQAEPVLVVVPQIMVLLEEARRVSPRDDTLLLEQVHRVGLVWSAISQADRNATADALADALRLRRDGWARSRALLASMSPALRGDVIDVLRRDRVRRPLLPAILFSP